MGKENKTPETVESLKAANEALEAGNVSLQNELSERDSKIEALDDEIQSLKSGNNSLQVEPAKKPEKPKVPEETFQDTNSGDVYKFVYAVINVPGIGVVKTADLIKPSEELKYVLSELVSKGSGAIQLVKKGGK